MSDGSSPPENPPDAGARITVEYTVPAMDCQSCVQTVSGALGRVDGVGAIDADPTAGVASVEYDPEVTDVEELREAIEGAGYDVAGVSEDGDGPAGVAPATDVFRSPRAIKTWIGAVLLAAGLVLEFLLHGLDPTAGELVSGLPELLAGLTGADLLLLAATAISGTPVVRSGLQSARARSLDIDLLMGTAIVAATGIGYFVEAATLAVLFSIAELLEDFAMDRARDSLRELLALSPEEATVRRDGEEVTVPADDVAVGETVLVRPGDKVPLDGIVLEGDSAVDESPITGESVPVDKTAGDEVFAGSIAEEGYLEVEVTSTAGESTLAQIIDLVRDAQRERTETEQFVDRFAGYYTPVIVALAILTAAVPPLLLGSNWETWFIRGLTLLVIACPCAFVISTPVSVVSGVTSAARNGVLIKGGRYLETMGEADAVALDKTGTLTKGELTVTDVEPADGADRAELLRTAAAIERRSEHPIAEAITARAEEDGVEAVEPEGFEAMAGKGVQADVDGTTYFAGTPALFRSLGYAGGKPTDARSDGGTPQDAELSAPSLPHERLAALEREGKTVVLIGSERELLGIVAVADEVRPEAARAVQRLQELGVGHVAMLTGDNDGTARAIAEQVGVDEYRAELLPEDKVDAIEELQAEHGTVAMVGDGINDAPALATADVGIAMGAAGTDTAIETADVALMSDDLTKLPYLYGLSNTANGVIRQNIWASLGVKLLLAIGVPLGYVTVAIAVVVGDMGMSLGVTGNAMRLSRLTPDRFFGD